MPLLAAFIIVTIAPFLSFVFGKILLKIEVKAKAIDSLVDSFKNYERALREYWIDAKQSSAEEIVRHFTLTCTILAFIDKYHSLKNHGDIFLNLSEMHMECTGSTFQKEIHQTHPNMGGVILIHFNKVYVEILKNTV